MLGVVPTLKHPEFNRHASSLQAGAQCKSGFASVVLVQVYRYPRQMTCEPLWKNHSFRYENV
jgi:hypothetical protein